MSCSVRGASHRDGINAWPDRAEINVRTIKAYAPDLIGLQEVHAPNLEIYERDLPGYERIMGPAYGTDTVEEFAAIFYDARRFEKLDADGFWLSDTPEESSASWGNEVVRSANWAVLRCRRTGVTFLHANTHLDHMSERARVEGNRPIVRQTEARPDNHAPPRQHPPLPQERAGPRGGKPPHRPPDRGDLREPRPPAHRRHRRLQLQARLHPLRGLPGARLRRHLPRRRQHRRRGRLHLPRLQGLALQAERHGQAFRAHRLDPAAGHRGTLRGDGTPDPARRRRRGRPLPERPR